MAQKTLVLLQDDIDGSEAAETLNFALDGVSYELDLSEKNAAGLRDALGRYIAHARRTGGRSTRRANGSAPARADREQLAAIRAWARSRGMDVNDRGRIPRHIVEQYNAGAAEPEPAPEPEAPVRRRRARKTA